MKTSSLHLEGATPFKVATATKVYDELVNLASPVDFVTLYISELAARTGLSMHAIRAVRKLLVANGYIETSQGFLGYYGIAPYTYRLVNKDTTAPLTSAPNNDLSNSSIAALEKAAADMDMSL